MALDRAAIIDSALGGAGQLTGPIVRALTVVGVAALVLASACSGAAAAPTVAVAATAVSSGGATKPFKVAMAVGGNTCCAWMKYQGDVARALAQQRGWDYVELSNLNDAPLATQNPGAGRAADRGTEGNHRIPALLPQAVGTSL